MCDRTRAASKTGNDGVLFHLLLVAAVRKGSLSSENLSSYKTKLDATWHENEIVADMRHAYTAKRSAPI